MDNEGLIGVFEPRCKIRFLSDPRPQEDYIAVSAKEYQELLADSMKMRALECSGVDNWEGHDYSLQNFKEELLDSYGNAFWQWVEHMKSNEQTCEEYVDEMTIEDFAGFEVDMML